ncbi:MAG: hypothetical protein RLZZ480_496 [Candidatus Parcubacteria bacterium]|jgi:hypothetical protein
MTAQVIQHRLQQLDPEYRAFVEDDFIEGVSEALAEPLGISGRSLEVLQNSFYLYLLFFFDKTTAVKFINTNCNLSEGDAFEIFSAFEASLPEELQVMVPAEYRKLNPPETSEELSAEFVEVEQAFQQLQGIRTMAGDASHLQPQAAPAAQPQAAAYVPPVYTPPAPAPTYQSNQDDLLARPTPPAAPTAQPPRWDSE